jgi:hypothetical protein
MQPYNQRTQGGASNIGPQGLNQANQAAQSRATSNISNAIQNIGS